MNLTDLLSGPAGKLLLGNLKSQVGLDDKQASNAIGVALPAILSGLNKNAQTAKGAESLNKALESKHDGGILKNLSTILGNTSSLQEDGNGILDHIFGSKKNSVQAAAAKEAGISTDKMGVLFSILAPVVMGYLGNEKKKTKADASGLESIIGGLLSSSTGSKSSAGGIMDMVGGLLGGSSQKKGGMLGGLMDMLKK